MEKKFISMVVLVVILVLVVVGCSPAATPTPATVSNPDTAKGKALVESKCTTCHSLSQVEAAKFDRAGWEATVQRMINNGAQLDAEQQKLVVDYLAVTFPK